MGTPFIGEIRMFGGNFAPRGFAFCHGQLLAISQNDVLFSLIGTTYGGDGQSTFALRRAEAACVRVLPVGAVNALEAASLEGSAA